MHASMIGSVSQRMSSGSFVLDGAHALMTCSNAESVLNVNRCWRRIFLIVRGMCRPWSSVSGRVALGSAAYQSIRPVWSAIGK